MKDIIENILERSKCNLYGAVTNIQEIITDEIDDTETILAIKEELDAIINHYSILESIRILEREKYDQNRDVHNR